jgi:hypothetical protein
MIQATIIKSSYEPFSFKRLSDQQETIQADDKDSLFALFFRKYDNAYKYCNSVSYALACPSLRQGYLAWFKDVRNYADNGGDMW